MTITGKIAKSVFEEMVSSRKEPRVIVKEKGLIQISDGAAIEQMCREVISENPKAVEELKAGKERALGALVGGVMKKSKGKANPNLVNEILLKLLK